MTLDEFLQQREKELLDEIKALRDQIRAFQAGLVPKEAELAACRRAMAAARTSNEATGRIGKETRTLNEFLGGIGTAFTVLQHGSLPFSRPIPPVLLSRDVSIPPQAPPASPYAHLTMKQLVVKALTEHFQYGATTRELLDFFRDAWGREIERTNLSPQISRLYKDGVIERHGTAWVLTDAELEQMHQADAERGDR